ncbi:autotransporter assembly complex protein TamA [Azorhizobium oxalatiphilum]|uniref:autotransporter assembly complex protein TamA n=1 Tax=Azorhizobium oxalatiphilum TaxID=980631 RepID=UPI001FCEA41F|nr:autotransporter assembly complex family protein [Azorhizobium oxalatiphilum]
MERPRGLLGLGGRLPDSCARLVLGAGLVCALLSPLPAKAQLFGGQGGAGQDAASQTAADPNATFFDKAMAWFNPNAAKNQPAVADATPYALTIDVTGDSAAKSAVTDASNLERLKTNAPSGAAGLVRRALADRERIIAALYAEGYYAGRIDITVAGVPADTVAAFDRVEAARKAGDVPVVVKVDTGPQFQFGTVRLVDPAGRPLMDGPSLKAMRLEAGQPAKATLITSAERTITTTLRNAGHPFARVASKDVVADHANRRVDVTYYVDPGRPATFGPFTVSGTKTIKPEFILSRVDIYPGEPYSPERLDALRKRLTAYEIIGSVRFREADRLNAQGQLPIEILVSERELHYVGFGAKYSSTDGSSANAFWGHRNLWGGGETLRLDAQVSWYSEGSDAVPNADPFGYRLAASFSKPGIWTANDDLVAEAAVLREVTDAYVREGVTFTGGVRHRFNEDWSGQVGVDLEQSTVQDYFGTTDPFIAGIPVSLTGDTTDNPLDATKGYKFTATVEPFVAFGDSGAGPVMLKASLSAYHAFDEDKRWILAGRVSAGSLIGPELLDVPAQRRFYVGGGGTVRGIDYQKASPQTPNGIVIGGLSYFTASTEMRIKITDTIGVVPFFDMGAAFASEVPDFSAMYYSAGIGLRYYTAVGPVRLDFAVPLNPPDGSSKYGVYLSLGQAF